MRADSLKEALVAAAKERGVRLQPDAIGLLIDLVGDDLRQLIYAVEKLVLFVGEGVEIRPQDIEAMVGETRVRSIFQLTDTVSGRDLDGALRSLTSLLEAGEEPLKILGMLARQIRLLFQAKALREQGTPVNRMTIGRLPPRAVATLAEQAASRSWGQLTGALQSISRADMAIKTGRSAGPMVLSELVWGLCRT
jgi:DNA polymerase-3 subunit delta